MLWIILAFLAAFFNSIKGVFSKKSVKNIDEYIVAWALRFFTSLFLLVAFLFIEIPETGDRYLMALLISGSVNVVTTVLAMKALKYSDLSIVAPIATLTPLFLLIISPLIIGEVPTIFGLFGVLLIVFGSYMLNIKKKKDGYFAPFKALLKERGALLMLLVAFLWSISSSFDKIGVQNSAPIFWAISVNAFVTLILFPVALFRLRKLKSSFTNRKLFRGLKTLIPMGIATALMLACQMTAINMALVIYVSSIREASAIISVLFGYFIFKEKNIKERLIGSAIMIVGVLFITLLG